MKYLILIIFPLMLLGGCTKEKVVKVEVPTIPAATQIFETCTCVEQAPIWNIAESQTKTQYSMTMVCIPEFKNYRFELSENDRLAVFDQDLCCGVGSMIKLGNVGMYFVMINLNTIPTENLQIKYFNAEKMMIFNNEEVSFYADKALGNPDEPYMLVVIQ